MNAEPRFGQGGGNDFGGNQRTIDEFIPRPVVIDVEPADRHEENAGAKDQGRGDDEIHQCSFQRDFLGPVLELAVPT